MSKGWELFHRTNTRKRDFPEVTIFKNGCMSLSEPVVRFIGSDNVVLLWNGKTRQIGIRATDADDPCKFELKPLKDQQRRLIRAIPFTKHHGLLAFKFKRYRPEMIDDMVIITL